MFGQQRKSASGQAFAGGTLLRALDEFELSLGGDLEGINKRGAQEVNNQRGWIVPTQQQDWREPLTEDSDRSETPGLPSEFALSPPQIGARVGAEGGGKSVRGVGNRRPSKRATPVPQPRGIRKSVGVKVYEPYRRRILETGARPGPSKRKAARLPQNFERFIREEVSRGWGKETMRYYLQELTDQDEPRPSGLKSLEQILRDDAVTLEQGEPKETWTATKFLGKGGFGDVILWQRRRDDGTVDQLAVKNTRFDDFFMDYSSEAHLTRRLNVAGCNNVIQVYDWAALERERRVRIIYAFYPLGDLMNTLYFYQTQRLTFPEAFLWHIFHNIATALCFCARGSVDFTRREGWEEVVHSDLKPENILMDSPDPAVNPYYPKLRLADFGLAFTVPNDMIRDFKRRYGTGGTPGFTAPEMRPELRGDPEVSYPFPGSHSDVHSLGDTLREFMNCAASRYPSYAIPLLREGIDEDWGWEYWPYSEQLTRLVANCRAPDGRDRPSAYALYLTTKRMSESMLEEQTAMEKRAQAGDSGRGLTSTTVLYTREQQTEYKNSDRFRDLFNRRTDWFHTHATDFQNLCDAARNPRPAPPGYVAIGNGLKFARIPSHPNAQDHRRQGDPGPRDSHIGLHDQQQGQSLPANVRAAGAALQGDQQSSGIIGKVKEFFSRMLWSG